MIALEIKQRAISVASIAWRLGLGSRAATQIAMIAGLPYTVLRDAILAHPTFVEGLHALFSSEPSGPSERVNQQRR
jgi:hypothetical protein